MKIIKEKNTIVFDLFHTLTDVESKWSAIPTTSELLGVSSVAWNDQLLLHSKDRLTGKVRDPFLIIKGMAHAINDAIPDEKITEVVAKRTQRFQHTLSAIPEGNLRTLEALKSSNKTLALLSNADIMERNAWDNSPLRHYFDVVIFSCDVGYAKPDAEIYELCLTSLNKTGRECVFVGDGGSNELVGARRAGMSTIFISGIMKELFPSKIEERKQQADFHIESISDLLG